MRYELSKRTDYSDREKSAVIIVNIDPAIRSSSFLFVQVSEDVYISFQTMFVLSSAAIDSTKLADRPINTHMCWTSPKTDQVAQHEYRKDRTLPTTTFISGAGTAACDENGHVFVYDTNTNETHEKPTGT
jgi:hypothetical protein